MANCVIVVKCKRFDNSDGLGAFVWQYDSATNFYALHIILNEELYTNEEMELRIKRKATGVHEFTHCVAAMLTFSRLQTPALIDLLNTRMSKTFHVLSKEDLESLFKELTMSFEEKLKTPSIFPDEHFRTGGEDFPDSYENLLRNFLLSYDLFCEDNFFNKEKLQDFNDLIKQGKRREAVQVLVSVIEPLSTAKALSQHFIQQRIVEEFLETIIKSIG